MSRIFSLIVSLWIMIDSSIFIYVSHDCKYLYLFAFIFATIELFMSKKHSFLKIRRSLLFSLLLGYGIIKLFTEYYSGLSICFVIIIVLIAIDYSERHGRNSKNNNN